MKNLNISQKLMLITSAFVFLSIAIIFLSVRFIARDALKEYFTNDLQNKSETMKGILSDMKENALHAVSFLENYTPMIAYYQMGDRIAALKRGKELMNAMHIDYLVITDTNGRVFIRAHAPDKFGDSIADQVNIQKALKGERSVGIEEGAVVKFSIRAGAPLRVGGRIIGAVSAGYVLSNENFVDTYKKILGCEITLFHGIERIATTLMKDGKRLTGTKLEHEEIIDTVFKKGKSYFGEATILGKFYFTAYHPIVDVKGNTAGILFMGKESEVASSIVRNLLGSLGIIFLIVGGFFIVGIRYSIRNFLSEKMNALKEFFEELAQGKGDLTKRMTVSSMDEIGVVIARFNEFLESLKDIITVVKDNSEQLAHSSEEITKATTTFSTNAQSQAAATEEITATIEQMAAGMDNIAASARFQHEKMDALMNTIHQLTEIIRDNSKNIKDTVSLANRIEANARDGEQSMKEMNLTMERITDSSKDMLGIVSIINDISDQINLLSLNAAIEAARAGEQGRGFAVVADEISKLADQTAQSIKEIDNLIKSNNEEINKGMMNVKKSIDIISTMIEGVEEIKKMIDQVYETTIHQIETNEEVNREAQTVKGRAEEISLAIGEHKSGVNEIVRSVSNVNELTQSIAGASEELTSNAEEIAAMAESLKSRVALFKVN